MFFKCYLVKSNAIVSFQNIVLSVQMGLAIYGT